MRVTKTVKKKRNDLKFKIGILTCFFKRHLKIKISLAFLPFVGNKFQSFAGAILDKNWVALKVPPTLLNYNYRL